MLFLFFLLSASMLFVISSISLSLRLLLHVALPIICKYVEILYSSERRYHLPHPPILSQLFFFPFNIPSTPPFLWQYFTAEQCNVFGPSADTSLETNLNSSTMAIQGKSRDGESMEKCAFDYYSAWMEEWSLEMKKERDSPH